MLASSEHGALLPSKKACERCASDKKKCDGHRPCKRCVVNRWTDDCVYVRSKKRGPPSKRALAGDLAKQKRKRQDDGQVDNGADNAVVPDPHLDEELAHEIAAIYHGILHLHNPVFEIGALSSIRAMEKRDEIAYRAAMGAAASLYACLSGPSKAKKEKALAYFCHTAQELGREIVELQQRIDDEEHSTTGRDGLRAAQINLVRYQLAVGILNFGLLKFELGWRRLGNAIRLLQFLQLHTQRHAAAEQTPGSTLTLSQGSGGASPSTMPAAAVARQQQECSRLFWQAYILDQITSVTLQRPPILRGAECDAPFPETDSVEEHKLWLTDLTRDLVNVKHQASLEGVKCHLNTSMRCCASLMTIHEKLHHYHLQPLQPAAASDTEGELPADHASSPELARHLARAGQALQKWKDGLPAPVAWQSPLLLPWDTVLPFSSSSTPQQGAPPPPADFRANDSWREGTAGSAQEDDLTPCFEAAIARHYGVSPQILTVRVWYCACLILFYRTHARFLMDGPASTTGHCCTFARLPFAFVQRAAMELCAILTSFDDVFSIRLSPVIQTHAIFQAAVIHAMAFSAWQREALSPAPVHPVLTRASVQHSQMLLRRCKMWLDSMGLQSRRVPARHSLILSKLDSTFGSRDDDRLARLPIDDSSIDDTSMRDTEGQGRAPTLPSFSDDETPSSRARHSTSSLQNPSGQQAPHCSALDQQWHEWFRSLQPSDTVEHNATQVPAQAPLVADLNPHPLEGGRASRENETTLTPAALFDSAWSQLPYSSNDVDEWMSFLERMPR